jgi:hypothetical protein
VKYGPGIVIILLFSGTVCRCKYDSDPERNDYSMVIAGTQLDYLFVCLSQITVFPG